MNGVTVLDWWILFIGNRSSGLTEKGRGMEEGLDCTPLGLILPTCLRAAFTRIDPLSVKRQLSHQCLFALLGFACAIAARKMLVKSTTGVNFINILGAHFLYKSALRSFSLVVFWLWQKYKSTFIQKMRV